MRSDEQSKWGSPARPDSESEPPTLALPVFEPEPGPGDHSDGNHAGGNGVGPARHAGSPGAVGAARHGRGRHSAPPQSPFTRMAGRVNAGHQATGHPGARHAADLGAGAALGAGAGQGEPDEAGQDAKARKNGRSLLTELPILVVVALVIALVIKTFIVQAFWIPTGSMQNTLEINDKILVNKLVYHFRSIEPGDIIVFNGDGTWNAPTPPATVSSDPIVHLYDDTLRPLFSSLGGLFGTPLDQVDYVKRVIGVPGDHVACCNAQGLVTVNGVPLHEQSYLYPGDQPGSAPDGIPGHFNVTVPPGYLWVLGDHRSVSDDSRGHEDDPGNGMVLESKVIGRAFVIVWPPSQWRFLSIPATFGQPGVDHPRASGSASGSGSASAGAARMAAAEAALSADVISAQVRPQTSAVPLAAGLAFAVPLTWLQRRARRRLRGWRSLRRGPGRGARGPAR
jgi:signal peptidase I